ncbi:hypothetical protein G6011_02522 [Alternaria panax]|uniref:Uncharacterized protein n=1 Tax=Alternaria panax TaxID=48097 RepID=A0AAD4I6Y9_9PLEO|nr:hypothetical protein G6011_02522 [Alternaria panax]
MLSGHLKTSDETYNRVFDLGEHSLLWGVAAANYTLEFDVKIAPGGAGWRAGSAMQPLGPHIVLTSEYPEQDTFTKHESRSLTSEYVDLHYWMEPENQYFTINATIKEGVWYRVSTSTEDTGHKVALNGVEVAFVPLLPPAAPRNLGTPSRYEGTWGFGGMQDHITYYKDVTVTAENGSIIYSNSFMSEDTLAEYQVAPLDHSVCLDDARRDRLIWTGDFYHTVRVVSTSSARFDCLLGTFEYALSYQLDEGPYAGFTPISANLGARPKYKEANIANYAGLVDCQDLFLA